MTLPHEIPATGPATALTAQMQAALPRLETERLVLRAPCLEDFAAYAEIATGPRGRYFMDSGDRTEAWLDFAQMVATWVLRGHGVWSVEPRAGGAVLGFVLIGLGPGDLEPELGYMFREMAEGRGYATEAATAARDYALTVLHLPSLVSYIDRDNTRSLAVAERLGANPDAELLEGCLVYRHPSPEAMT